MTMFCSLFDLTAGLWDESNPILGTVYGRTLHTNGNVVFRHPSFKETDDCNVGSMVCDYGTDGAGRFHVYHSCCPSSEGGSHTDTNCYDNIGEVIDSYLKGAKEAADDGEWDVVANDLRFVLDLAKYYESDCYNTVAHMLSTVEGINMTQLNRLKNKLADMTKE